MKLAEALITRADLQRRIEQLRARIVAAARYQEGEEPQEDAASLVEEASAALDRLEELVVAVNLTNATVHLADGSTMTAPDAAARATAAPRSSHGTRNVRGAVRTLRCRRGARTPVPRRLAGPRLLRRGQPRSAERRSGTARGTQQRTAAR